MGMCYRLWTRLTGPRAFAGVTSAGEQLQGYTSDCMVGTLCGNLSGADSGDEVRLALGVPEHARSTLIHHCNVSSCA